MTINFSSTAAFIWSVADLLRGDHLLLDRRVDRAESEEAPAGWADAGGRVPRAA